MTTEVMARRASAELNVSPETTASGGVKRIYISNLDFDTNEEDLKQFLQEFNVLTVLIPSQTVRGFRNSSVRPLGIGYADFATAEDAQNAVKNLNGQKLHDRALKMKMYAPFVAKRKERRPSKKQNSTSVSLGVNRSDPVMADTTAQEPVAAEAQEPVDTTVEATAPLPEAPKTNSEPVSDDTLYCAYLPSNVTDVELREFFADYDPQDIYVYRSSVSRHRIHLYRRFTAALVTLGAPNSLENAISQLSKQKLMGKKITLKPARLSKMQEVKKAAAKKMELEQAQMRKQSIADDAQPIAENQELETTEAAPAS
ncbi:LAME_0H18008g1_1 [Lachancea meyersii CBS 8951]|uniref:Regulator of rDNA transcription protein 5 n=1 Tax=Lachancea meyersii CBS 8951 TaxID=1266667 RepID=A0A1G4KIP4_9SACH|nr:LAME_0H18008g1_1 [Lachancea meyersii CBS 8951]